MHDPGGDGSRMHAHVGIPTRALGAGPDGQAKFGSKLREWDVRKPDPTKGIHRTGKDLVGAIRREWAEHCNAFLLERGHSIRIDHRSNRDRGSSQEPQAIYSRAEWQARKRGERTETCEINCLITERNRLAAERERRPVPSAPPQQPQPQQESPMKKFTPRGRVAGRGGRPPRRPPPQQQHEPRQPREQTDDLRKWLWAQAYGPAAMPRGWLLATTALWTFARDGEASRRLLDRLRDGRKRYAPGIHIDMIVAGVKRDGAGHVYLHFHVVTRGGSAAELAALRQFFVRTCAGLLTGWDWWDAETDVDDEDDRTERHPVALVQYAAKGLAEELDEDWTPEELAEMYRQTRGVAMVLAAGEFRRWLGDLDRAGLTVRRGEYGVAEIVPKRPQRLGIRRHRERLFHSVGFAVVRRLDEYDFGDGIRRRAWLVRGHAGLAMTDIANVYVLDAPSTDHASIPESLPATAIGHPQSPDERRPPDPPTGMD